MPTLITEAAFGLFATAWLPFISGVKKLYFALTPLFLTVSNNPNITGVPTLNQ